MKIVYSRDSRDLPHGDAYALTTAHEQDAWNALRYLVNAHENEPLFVIRGRDLFALPVLMRYHTLMNDHGLHDMAEQVSLHRERFYTFQRDNRELVKIPDAYPGWQHDRMTVDADGHAHANRINLP